MATDDILKQIGIECACFDELQQSRLVFCAASLQCDCCEMFSGEDVSCGAFDIYGACGFKRFLD